MDKNKKIAPVYEKGYPCYEAVNNTGFDYDTYGGGVEYFGGFNSDYREQILFKRRDDRTTTS